MSDYLFMLDSHLNAGQNRAVAKVQQLATNEGMNVWLTGGAMRDMLRGAPIRDLDFTVEHDAIKIGKAAAAETEGKVIFEDPLKRYVELLLPDNTSASISNARTEKYSKPGGKPQIEAATIHADLSRRDFTINAIGLSLNRGSRGLLVDPANGQADLMSRELRATNSYVFFDDPARLYRMLRFQHVLGFTVVPRLAGQLENALIEGYQSLVPASTVGHEIRAAALDPNAAAMLDSLDQHGMLKPFSAALTGPKLNTAGIARSEELAHTVLPAGFAGGWYAFLFVLLEPLTVRERAEVVRAFELTPAETAMWKKLDSEAAGLETALKAAKTLRPSQVWETLNEATADQVLMVLYRSGVRVVQDRVRAYYEKYLPLAQEVTDEDVVTAGGKAGTAKFEKLRRTLITTRLNARPKKVELVDEDILQAAVAGAGAGRERK